MAYEDNIEHRSRHVPWTTTSSQDADWWMGGVNWEAGNVVLTFCDAPGGAAKITLTNQAAGVQGIALTYDPEFVAPDGSAIGGTRMRPQIDEATLEALEWGPDPKAPLVLYYDLLVTPPAEAQQALFYGTFTLYPGEGD